MLRQDSLHAETHNKIRLLYRFLLKSPSDQADNHILHLLDNRYTECNMFSRNESEIKSMQRQGTIQTSNSSSRGRGSGVAVHPTLSIRIVHIFAPKIIKTDAANFRSLVQSLTGRSSSSSSSRGHVERRKKKKKSMGLRPLAQPSCHLQAHDDGRAFHLPQICSTQQQLLGPTQLSLADHHQVKSQLYADLDAESMINRFASFSGNILDGLGEAEFNSAWPGEFSALLSPATNHTSDLNASFSPPSEPGRLNR